MKIRTSVVLSDVLYANLKALCQKQGKTQTEVIREALVSHLDYWSLQPDKFPTVSTRITYPTEGKT